MYIKAEIVRIRSFGRPQIYRFWRFEVQEQPEQSWTESEVPGVVVFLTTEYGLLEGSGYRDHRKFRIEERGRVELIQAYTFGGMLVERGLSRKLAVGVLRSVVWPG